MDVYSALVHVHSPLDEGLVLGVDAEVLDSVDGVDGSVLEGLDRGVLEGVDLVLERVDGDAPGLVDKELVGVVPLVNTRGQIRSKIRWALSSNCEKSSTRRTAFRFPVMVSNSALLTWLVIPIAHSKATLRNAAAACGMSFSRTSE